MALAKIVKRNRKRGDLIVYDSGTVERYWLTLYNGNDVVLRIRWSEIDEVERIN
jgi:hypothetical protein